MERLSLDAQLKRLKQEINDLNRTDYKLFTSFESIGLISGEETIEDIANYLPNYSTLIIHKTRAVGNNEEYPFDWGLLTVTKGLSSARTTFNFDREDGIWRGFFNSGS